MRINVGLYGLLARLLLGYGLSANEPQSQSLSVAIRDDP